MRVTFTDPTMLADDTMDQIGTTVKITLPTRAGGTNCYDGTLVEVGNGFIVVELED